MTMLDLATAKAIALDNGHTAIERHGLLFIGKSAGIVVVDGYISQFDFNRRMEAETKIISLPAWRRGRR